jgi:hypothetical protein
MEKTQKISIFFIVGISRNGSTLLSRILGECEGFYNIGEAVQTIFTNRSDKFGIPCGCGASRVDCLFWNRILSSVAIKELRSIGISVLKNRRLPELMMPIKTASLKRDWDSLRMATRSILEQIQEATGCEVIVESSKNPVFGYLLSQVPGVEMHTIHLLRDPRGVIDSWSHAKGYLPAFPLLTTIGWYISNNAWAKVLQSVSATYQTVRFEDLLAAPMTFTREILSQTGKAETATPVLEKDMRIIFRKQHLLGGNPDKLSTDKTDIRERESTLSFSKRLLVTILTLPYILRYRYPLRP